MCIRSPSFFSFIAEGKKTYRAAIAVGKLPAGASAVLHAAAVSCTSRHFADQFDTALIAVAATIVGCC